MLMHKINSYWGKKVHDGKEFHAYKTICGTEIIAAQIFKQNQLISVGQEPHAQCAKCFKAHQAQSGNRVIEGDRPVADPDRGGFHVNTPRVDGQMLDDKGMPISAPINQTDIVGNAAMDPYSGKTLGVKKTQREGDRVIKTEVQDPMGDIESSDYA